MYKSKSKITDEIAKGKSGHKWKKKIYTMKYFKIQCHKYTKYLLQSLNQYIQLSLCIKIKTTNKDKTDSYPNAQDLTTNSDIKFLLQ